jgi:hypothetical protein
VGEVPLAADLVKLDGDAIAGDGQVAASALDAVLRPGSCRDLPVIAPATALVAGPLDKRDGTPLRRSGTGKLSLQKNPRRPIQVSRDDEAGADHDSLKLGQREVAPLRVLRVSESGGPTASIPPHTLRLGHRQAAAGSALCPVPDFGKGGEGLVVGFGERVQVLLCGLDLGVPEPIHHRLEVGASSQQP